MKLIRFISCILCYFLLLSNNIVINYAYNWPSSMSSPHSWPASLRDDTKIIYGDITVQVMLSTKDYGCSTPSLASFHFGFFGNYVGAVAHDNYMYTLGIFIGVLDPPQEYPALLWYANGNHPVSSTAILDLTADTGLVLKDQDGLVVWSSSNTSGGGTAANSAKSVNLTCEGNLVMLGDKGEVLWQSFDHPTDTWLSGQTLHFGQILTSRVSSNNLSVGNYYLSIGESEATAFFVDSTNLSSEYGLIYFLFYHFLQQGNGYKFKNINFFDDDNIYYFRLDFNGHVNAYKYNATEELTNSILSVSGDDECGYPETCGKYGVCYHNSECVCPQDNGNENYFRSVDTNRYEMGCTPINPLSCIVGDNLHTLVKLENVTYFGFQPTLVGVNLETCKASCLRNCSCKAAIFHHREHVMSGNCSLQSEVYTLIHLDGNTDTYFTFSSSAFVKVQKPTQKQISTPDNKSPDNKSRSLLLKLLPSLAASILIIGFFAGACYYVKVVQRKKASESHSDDLMIDTISRFSFESMRLATQDFRNRLGRGGFGSVFEGALEDGTKIAVKCLDSVGQGRKEFLAEVNTIGTLHHYNLVKLIGFCDDGLNRLLIYEFLPNGSLDKWIFNQEFAQTLTWVLRRRIIGSIAKGLEYLHENCLQTVIHFDIKPQNILLDKEYNVKIANFGLAKMVDRDQSHVMTIIRGTPGYMAPELITAQVVSVKVDVYSFGVLILEIVCGRKNSSSSEHHLLINLVKVKADEDRLSDLIDGRVEDMQHNKEEAVKMMKIAIWCLQPHFIRPNMSMVVKVLQDIANIDALTDLSYLTMVHENTPIEMNTMSYTRPTESLLSGPR